MNSLEETFANLERRGMSRPAADMEDRPAAAAAAPTKGETTTRAAKAIIDAETEARHARTAALREARLNMEKSASATDKT